MSATKAPPFNPKNIKAILFDLDDTIIDSEAAYAKALKHIGIEPNDKHFFKARAEVKKRLPKNAPNARSRALYFKKMLENSDNFSARKALHFTQNYESKMAELMAKEFVKLKRKTLLTKLSKKYRLALVTNETLRTQLMKLNAIDPRGELFDFMLTSEEAGVEKPHPTIFKMALEKLNLKANEVLFVGDHPQNDMLGAKRVGMLTCLTTEFIERDHSKSSLRSTDINIKSLNELLLVSARRDAP